MTYAYFKYRSTDHLRAEMQLFQLVKLAKLVKHKVESSFVESKQDFHVKFKLLSYLLQLCIFSLEHPAGSSFKDYIRMALIFADLEMSLKSAQSCG